LTILSEDSPDPKNPELKYGHGLAVHVSVNGISILYDFGPGGTLLPNSGKLGIRLEDVDVAILSHGHYDHSGDIEAFLSVNSKAVIHHGRDAFSPRWSISGGAPREVGVQAEIASLQAKMPERFALVGELEDRKDFVILPAAPGLRAKPSGNSLLLAGSEGERLQDDFVDELTLVVRGEEGLVVLTGCSHRGILNIADQVKTYCSKCPFRALIGGFHLRDKEETDTNLRFVAESLGQILPEGLIYSGHCTENRASGILEETLGNRYEKIHTGRIMKF
jgi:7,8-dihydropterin-6-yl-methyl-4-(beta-D-ribofuranosyl)aminobenzene 5'-phosphate synthase